MSHTPLNTTQIEEALSSLPEWALADGKMHRAYRFPDFVSAFDWMTLVAAEAERLAHHPEWFNVYNRVEVTLWTHDAGGLTELDVALARFMDSEASEAQ